jgi:hypothetical protein
LTAFDNSRESRENSAEAGKKGHLVYLHRSEIQKKAKTPGWQAKRAKINPAALQLLLSKKPFLCISAEKGT